MALLLPVITAPHGPDGDPPGRGDPGRSAPSGTPLCQQPAGRWSRGADRIARPRQRVSARFPGAVTKRPPSSPRASLSNARRGVWPACIHQQMSKSAPKGMKGARGSRRFRGLGAHAREDSGPGRAASPTEKAQRSPAGLCGRISISILARISSTAFSRR